MTVIYSAAMSLDGYISGPDGDMSWLSGFAGGSNPTADRLLASAGCLLIGRRTYRGDDPNAGTDSEGAFGGRYDGPSVVLSRSPDPASDTPVGTEFATEIVPAVARARELAGDRSVIVLGAHTARSCLEADLLDEILLFVVPIMLGDGTPVLHRQGGLRVELDPLPDADHWYRIRR